MDYLFYIFAVLFFVAVVLLLEGGYLWWNSTRGPQARRIARRLRVMSAGSHKDGEDLSILKQRLLSETPAFQRLLLEIPRIHSLDRLLEQSGLRLTVGQFIGLSLVTFACGFGFAWLIGMAPSLRVAVAFVGGALPTLHVLRRRRLRLLKIEEQLPDALDLITRALRAGHAFPSALKMTGDEMVDPIAGEFRAAFDEVNYGISMNQALTNLATRVPSTDLRYFVIAVLIQRETGGNLTEVLTNIATLIRERLKLQGTIRVLSAEGRLSAWILSLLPLGTAMMIQIVNPGFLRVLWEDQTGLKMLIAAVVMMGVGIGWMRSIIRIHI